MLVVDNSSFSGLDDDCRVVVPVTLVQFRVRLPNSPYLISVAWIKRDAIKILFKK